MKKNLLVAQSGGPSAVINSTLAGVIQRALISDEIGRILGGVHGIKGVMEDNIVELDMYNTAQISLLTRTPASALGTCRFKLKNDPAEFKIITDTFKKHNVGYFVYIGGNDSMDTVLQLSKYCEEQKMDVRVVGAPKTIDNDLMEMDHTPGFGSAAKYIAASITEIFCDVVAFDIKALTIIEVMGRNAGWLTAAAALSSVNGGPAPHFIYLPEVAFSEEKFLADIKAQFEKTPYVLAVVSEGVKTADGAYICEQGAARSKDAFGHTALSGTASYLAGLAQAELGCKVRPIEFSLLQRCAAHLASATDVAEAKVLGSAALTAALSGQTGVMSRLLRTSTDPYRVEYGIIETSKVANHEKRVPLEWLNAEKNNVNEKMIEYLLPLIQGESVINFKNGVPEFYPAIRK
ncbi:MAG: 6-phosphofructokinase [Defluviitaleaceae bacterium]|nr:6-phosphofructokinase [Defluviitaleaceae bacterium]